VSIGAGKELYKTRIYLSGLNRHPRANRSPSRREPDKIICVLNREVRVADLAMSGVSLCITPYVCRTFRIAVGSLTTEAAGISLALMREPVAKGKWLEGSRRPHSCPGVRASVDSQMGGVGLL